MLLIMKYPTLAKRINRKFLYMGESDVEYILQEFERFERIQADKPHAPEKEGE